MAELRELVSRSLEHFGICFVYGSGIEGTGIRFIMGSGELDQSFVGISSFG